MKKGLLEREDSSIFEFESPHDFLRSILRTKVIRNRGFSLRAWAKQLGLRTPSLLSDVLREKRSPSENLLLCLDKNLDLTREESKYLRLLFLHHQAKTTSAKEAYRQLMTELKPPVPVSQMDLDTFNLLTSWYYLVLLEMAGLKDFETATNEHLAQRLGNGVTKKMVSDAIETLLRLNLLARDADGKLRKTGAEIRVGDSIPSENIRRQHEDVLKIAIAKQRLGSLEEKDFRGSNIAIKKENIGLAKSLIRRFHNDMWKLASEGDADHVYRFNSQFFQLTEEPK